MHCIISMLNCTSQHRKQLHQDFYFSWIVKFELPVIWEFLIESLLREKFILFWLVADIFRFFSQNFYVIQVNRFFSWCIIYLTNNSDVYVLFPDKLQYQGKNRVKTFEIKHVLVLLTHLCKDRWKMWQIACLLSTHQRAAWVAWLIRRETL